MAVMEGEGTRVRLVRYAEDNSIAFTIGGKHLHTLSHSDIEKVSNITSKQDVMFISDAYNNNSGRIVVTIRIYK